MAKRRTKQQRLADAKTVSLTDWIGEIKAAHSKESDQSNGACLISIPSTGQNVCVQTTKAVCQKMKGYWVGGPCGG